MDLLHKFSLFYCDVLAVDTPFSISLSVQQSMVFDRIPMPQQHDNFLFYFTVNKIRKSSATVYFLNNKAPHNVCIAVSIA